MVYISKLLLRKKSITLNAKEQLNSLLCIFAKKISTISNRIVSYSKRRTITENDIKKACLYIGFDIKDYENTLESYNLHKSDKGSRQSKANLTFSVALCESFLKEHSTFFINKLSPVLLAYVLEKISYLILFYSDTKRITIRHIFFAIQNTYLVNILHKYKIQLIGGGVVPYIHSSLVPPKEDKISFIKKRHYNKHNVIKEIKRLQNTYDSLIFAKLPFEKFIKKLFEMYKECRVQNNLYVIIQYYVEQYLIDILNKANKCAIHANRTKVVLSDIKLVKEIL